VASSALLDLQRGVVAAVGEPAYPHFGVGDWSPHVTLARRLAADQLGPAVQRLAGSDAAGRVVRVTSTRRWDSDARTAWLL